MSRESVLARGRAAALAGMVDTGTLTRVTITHTNPDTGVTTEDIETIYSGPCRLQERVPAGARAVEAAEEYAQMLRLVVQLPMSVTGAREGDLFTVDTSAHDADLVGRVLVVKELAHKTHLTARRLGCEERT